MRGSVLGSGKMGACGVDSASNFTLSRSGTTGLTFMAGSVFTAPGEPSRALDIIGSTEGDSWSRCSEPVFCIYTRREE